MTNFSLPTPQVASLYVTAGKSSLPDIKRLPAFLEEIDIRLPTPSWNKRWYDSCCRLMDRRQALDDYI